jgi:ribosomal protein S18 acetylase RimI-like enzyme
MVQIRRGTPEDADFLAWVMLAASRAHLTRGIWDLIVGADEKGCLDYLARLATAQPQSLCHYQSFLIAEWQGQPAAALSGFDIRAGGWATVGSAMSNVQRELGWTQADFLSSSQRIAPVWNCFLPDRGADWGVENVATLPPHRRRGLVQALLQRAISEADSAGGKLAQITTYIGNHPAISAYQKSGFSISDEKRCGELESLLSAPGFVRLIREL